MPLGRAMDQMIRTVCDMYYAILLYHLLQFFLLFNIHIGPSCFSMSYVLCALLFISSLANLWPVWMLKKRGGVD